MIRLKIDGQEVPVDQKSNISITAGIAEIEEPETSSSGYSKNVEVPFTPRSMAVFGFVNELYSKEQFNNALHTAELMQDDTVLLSGIVYVEKVACVPGPDGQTSAGAFHITVVGASFTWITRAKSPVNTLRCDEVVKYEMQSVYDNSINEQTSLIKFFPVDRGAFWREGVDDKKTERTELDLRDYHPFVNVWRLLELIFEGFAVRTSMRSVFEKLYCSGYMPQTEDASYVKEENDFLCGTTYVGENVPHVKDSYAHFKPNLFNQWSDLNGNYFVATDGILSIPSWVPDSHTIFTPTCALSVAFKIALTYVSSIGKNGEFIDRFSFGGANELYSFTMKDSAEAKEEDKLLSDFPWWTQNANSDKYLCWFKLKDPVRFEGVHRVLYDNNGNLMEDTLIAGIKPGGQYLYLPWLGGSLGKYYFRTWGGEKYDFGKRDFVEEFSALQLNDGQITFELKTTTNSHSVDEGEFYLIDCVLYASNMETVDQTNPLSLQIEQAELSPEFKNAIGMGDDVSLETIGATAPQLDFLAALRQMFNLMFYTNPNTQEVFINPRTSFYNLERGEIIDWRYKIDYSKPIEIQELGGDVGRSLRLSYADGSEVIQRYNWKNRTDLGAWETPLLNKTSDEKKEIANPIFAPFLLRDVTSVGMSLIQDQPEKTQDVIEEANLDITPIVGYFAGVGDRTAGDDLAKWPKYPRLVFQDAARGINLGFGDMAGASKPLPGLRQHYEDNISAYDYGRRITIYLDLDAPDLEAMQMPNSLKYDLRAVFMLCVDGEDVPCLLEEIVDYKPGSGASTKCQFICDPNIRLTGKEMVMITYDNEALTHRNTGIAYRQKE